MIQSFKSFVNEEWKEVFFDFPISNKTKYQISNFGRICSISEYGESKILKGSEINGYKILRLKLFLPKSEIVIAKTKKITDNIFYLQGTLRILKKKKANEKIVISTKKILQEERLKLSLLLSTDTKERTKNYHCLTHRLVATYFLPKPQANQKVVAHIDYNKQNNSSKNLVWMTEEENYAHQQNSPNVKADKLLRKDKVKNLKNISKLSVPKVMLIKKKLAEGVTPMTKIARQFKVTPTQIKRIKTGENWGKNKRT